MYRSVTVSDFYAKPIDVQLSPKELRCLANYLRKYPDEARKQPEVDFSSIQFDRQNLSWEQINIERR